MGEVVVTSEDLEVVMIEEEQEEEKKNNNSKEGEERGEGEGSVKSGVVKSERLLPRMVLRVLLVEADDSTRQIIAALLRKCNYRVAAVPDGLKAWEVLKGRPHNIDLILTEVELPSISGYALLTLIMADEICKNIPVIMMSSQDSVSLVYKCMLRGAADYLVKPLRRNELRNLWQHVWRKRSSLFGGSGPLDGSTRQDKVEGTSENDAASNHGSLDMACMQRSKEYIEKGSDAQSSCTKPDMEAESAQVEEVQKLVQPVRRNFPNDKEVHRQETHENIGQQFCMDENEPGEKKRLNDSDAREVCDNNDVFVNSSREAIDFMGTSSNHDSCSNNVKGKFEYSPHLDLSLRRSIGFDIQVAEEKTMLRHSSASAFTRYKSRAVQPLCSTSATVLNSEPGVDSDWRRSTNVSIHISSTLGQAPSTQRSIISLGADQTKESELSTCPKQRVIPIQIPMEGMTFNKLCTSYGSVFPPMLGKQLSASPNPSPSSASQRESNPKANPYLHSNFEINSAYLHHLNTNDPTNQSLQKQEQNHKLDTLEENGHISPATDQSANSSFCNGALSRLNSMGHGSTSGSNSNLDQVATVRAVAQSKNEENIFPHNSNSHRSIQREAALNKFRMKRKDRCYEKKVRYESRKKLAEQRPRVKGQFVRQAQVDPPSAETK